MAEHLEIGMTKLTKYRCPKHGEVDYGQVIIDAKQSKRACMVCLFEFANEQPDLEAINED